MLLAFALSASSMGYSPEPAMTKTSQRTIVPSSLPLARSAGLSGVRRSEGRDKGAFGLAVGVPQPLPGVVTDAGETPRRLRVYLNHPAEP